MKFLKGFGTFILAVVLVALITTLSLCMVFRNILQNDMVINIAKQEIQSSVEKELNESQKEELNKILNDKEVDKIVNNIIDEFIKYAGGNSTGVSKKIVNSIVTFVTNHKEQIESISGEKLDMDEITSKESLNELEKSINDAFEELKESIDSEDENLVKNITYLFTNSFKLIIMASILLVIVLLMLISWSYYKWLFTFGISAIISGAFVLVLYCIIKYVFGYLIKEELNISIDPKIGLIAGIVEIVIGIMAIIAKNKIDKE